MNKSITKVLSVFLVTLSMMACSSPKQNLSSYYTSKIECLGTELDGSETLLAWGTGKNKADALEQAKKNAVHAVLFKGIVDGTGQCNKRPLMLEVNAEVKYQDYFNAFFRDNGEYKKFVSMKDTRKSSIKGEANDNQQKYSIVVRVLRAELKEKLINDNILKLN